MKDQRSANRDEKVCVKGMKGSVCMLGRYVTHLSRKSTDKYVNNLGNVAGSRDVLII